MTREKAIEERAEARYAWSARSVGVLVGAVGLRASGFTLPDVFLNWDPGSYEPVVCLAVSESPRSPSRRVDPKGYGSGAGSVDAAVGAGFDPKAPRQRCPGCGGQVWIGEIGREGEEAQRAQEQERFHTSISDLSKGTDAFVQDSLRDR